jgi:hypothetical protein
MKTQDAIVLPSIILFVGGLGWYFWDDIMGEKPPGMPNYDHEIGGGGKKTRHRRHKKSKNTRRK